MGREYSMYGERRSAYRVLVEKPEGKKPLWRPRSRWEDNKKTIFRWFIPVVCVQQYQVEI